MNAERSHSAGESRSGRVAAKGGLGATYGFNLEDALAPVINGKTVFGGGKKAALKGTICVIDPGTRRVRDIERCTAVGTVYADQLPSDGRFRSGFLNVTTRRSGFAIDYRGTFTVRIAGQYQFSLLSCDGSILWIDEEEFINRDRPCSMDALETPDQRPKAQIKSIDLAAGPHSIRLLYMSAVAIGATTVNPDIIALSVRRLSEPRTPMMPWKADIFR